MLGRVSSDPQAPIVGRQHETDLLWREVAAARAGSLRMALLAGEPGIGKTRLLHAIARRATDDGALVLRGGATEAEGMPPYLPFLEALGAYIHTADADVLRKQAGPLVPVLSTILPELAARLGDSTPGYALPPEQARFRLFEAAGQLLEAIGESWPVLLLLDDLQWADSASFDLLCSLARRRPAARLCIIGAYRAGEAERNSALIRAMEELNRHLTLTVVPLPPLAAPDVAALAERYLHAPLAPAAVQRIAVQSEGNPFLVEELLRGWLETGQLAHKPGQPFALTTDNPVLPGSIVGAVRSRLGRLPTDLNDLLQVAATIGRAFEPALLATVAGLGEAHVQERLQLAETAQLLRATDSGYAFVHDTVRECLAGELSTVRRRYLHGVIGRTLEASSEPADAQRLAALAFHFANSGDRQRGAAYALRAAKNARQQFALEDALTHAQLAVDLLDAAAPERGEALLTFGEIAEITGDEIKAAKAFVAAREWFEARGQRIGTGRASHRLGRAFWRQERIADAEKAFGAALAAFESSDGSAVDRAEEQIRALIDYGSLLVISLHRPEGLTAIRRAVELAELQRDPLLLAAASRSLGTALVRSSDLAGGIRLLEQALDLASRCDASAEASECCAMLATAYLWQGSPSRAYQIGLQRLAFARQSHDSYELRHVYTMLSIAPALCGNLDEAGVWMERAQQLIEQLASPEPIAYHKFVAGMIAMMGGRLDSAETLLRESVEMFRTMGPGELIWYLGTYAQVLVACDKRRQALEVANEVEALIAAVPVVSMPAAEAYAALMEVALALGDRERVYRYRQPLVPFRGLFANQLVDRLLGEAALLEGDLAVALDLLASAEAIARRENIVWELARILETQAKLTRAHQQPGPEANTLLTEAIAIYEKLGNSVEADRLRSQRNSTRRSRREPLPAGLSPREAEVLRLVAAGKSNREIAGALIVSEKTVETHLTSIYGKIGAENRAMAAVFAARNGLS